MTSTERLNQRITELEGDLLEAREYKFGKTTYIHETQELYCADGEMHIHYDNDKLLIYNTEQLYKDLPFIINQVIKENAKMQKHYLGQIKKELMDLIIENEPEDKYMDVEDQVVNNPKDI